jgi:hypothetical protein
MKTIFTLLAVVFSALVFGGSEYFIPTAIAFVGLSFLLPKEVVAETIGLTQARGVYTDTMVALYRERVAVMSFFRSFFPSKTVMSKYVSIEVRRGSEKIAVDVIRGTSGNGNKATKSTEKVMLPPAYHEWFTANHLDVYDRAIGSTDPTAMASLAQESAEMLQDIQDKIDRAIEKMCADVMTDGIITLVNGDSIDFKRKAASKVAYNASWNWADNSVSPYTTFANAAKFLREVGKSQGSTYNVILGGAAMTALLNNEKFLTRQDLVNLKLDNVSTPVKNSVGATYHGRITEGSYSFDLWTYPEVYEDANGNMVPYMDAKKVIFTAEMPKFQLAFGLVEQLIDGQVPQTGPYLVYDTIDVEKTSHKVHMKSCPLPIPVAIDQLYTIQVLAS